MLLFGGQVITCRPLRVGGPWATLRPPGLEPLGNTPVGIPLTVRFLVFCFESVVLVRIPSGWGDAYGSEVAS